MKLVSTVLVFAIVAMSLSATVVAEDYTVTPTTHHTCSIMRFDDCSDSYRISVGTMSTVVWNSTVTDYDEYADAWYDDDGKCSTLMNAGIISKTHNLVIHAEDVRAIDTTGSAYGKSIFKLEVRAYPTSDCSGVRTTTIDTIYITPPGQTGREQYLAECDDCADCSGACTDTCHGNWHLLDVTIVPPQSNGVLCYIYFVSAQTCDWNGDNCNVGEADAAQFKVSWSN